MKAQHDKITSPPFDPNVERPAELDELNFHDEDEPSFQDFIPEIGVEYLEESGEQHADEDADENSVDNEGTKDDLTPDILIPDDGSRSPYEPGGSIPQDECLSIVNEDEIGEGYGLDEAELARVDPLDGKPEPLDKPDNQQ